MLTSRYRTIMLFIVIGIILSTAPCAACQFFIIAHSFTDWCIIGTLTPLLFITGITTKKKAIADSIILIVTIVFAFLCVMFRLKIFIFLPVISIIFAFVIGRRIVSKYKEQNKKNVMAIYLTLLVILVFYFQSNVVAMRCRATCGGYLYQIGKALEMYADDHKTKYPAALSELSPKYLKEVPDCAPYITRFSLPPQPKSLKHYCPVPYQYEVNSARDRYTITCKSRNHDFIYNKPGFPYYTSTQGEILSEE